MLRSLLVGLVVSTIPLAALADPPRRSGRERPVASSRGWQRPEASRPAQARGPKPKAHVAPGRPFGVHRPQPAHGRPRDGDARPGWARAPRECHEVSEPPQIALFLLGVGGLALLGRRNRRRRPIPLDAHASTARSDYPARRFGGTSVLSSAR
jgi:hypothetical protein